jgi:hypothetical protein
MNIHLAITIDLYESRNINLQEIVGWHLCHGIVVSNPKVFGFGFHSHSSDPEKPVTFEHSDTLYVTMCCGDMLYGLAPFKDNYKYIAFRRDFKESNRLRLLDIKNLYSKL